MITNGLSFLSDLRLLLWLSEKLILIGSYLLRNSTKESLLPVRYIFCFISGCYKII